MPVPRPLSPFQAKRSLANRLGPTADRVRQIATRLGVRPYRVFLVWSTFTGDERGEGTETEVQRIEILPTPRVAELTALQNALYGGGALATGTLRVDLISVQYSQATLTGLAIPGDGQDTGSYPPRLDFWWEIRPDGRGGDVPVALRFRVSSMPMLLSGQVGWAIVLEKQEEPTNPRDQLPPFALR